MLPRNPYRSSLGGGVLYLLGSFSKLHGLEPVLPGLIFHGRLPFASCAWIAFEHKRYRFHLVTGCNRNDILVKWNRAALIYLASGKTSRMVWKSIPRFLSPMIKCTPVSPRVLSTITEERTPAFTILFHLFRSTCDFPAAILTGRQWQREQKRSGSLPQPRFQVNTIYVNIG